MDKNTLPLLEDPKRFNNISVLDTRYADPENMEYGSELARVAGQLEFEKVLVLATAEVGLISLEAAEDIAQACDKVRPREVYIEEYTVTKHDIRALVNCIARYLRDSDNARFIHLGVTSYDTINSAEAKLYIKYINLVLIVQLKALEREFVLMAMEHAGTAQIGRSHGKHGEPITWGFAIALFVERLGECIRNIAQQTMLIPGKVSGAMGSGNGLQLLVPDAEKFERIVLGKLGVPVAPISSQIVPPEPLTRVLFEIILACGVMDNLAENLRILQFTEIDEVGEGTSAKQVGSSTMPHKRGNPIGCENVCALYKVVMPKINTVLLNQKSWLQRDLTISASSRTYVEIIAYAVIMAKRLRRVMAGLVVNVEQMEKNLTLTGDLSLSEPMYIMLARYGCPNAHEQMRLKVAELAEMPIEERPTLLDAVRQDEYLAMFAAKFTLDEICLLSHPRNYTGFSEKKAIAIARKWSEILELDVEILA